jgi:hypothetical protein
LKNFQSVHKPRAILLTLNCFCAPPGSTRKPWHYYLASSLQFPCWLCQKYGCFKASPDCCHHGFQKERNLTLTCFCLEAAQEVGGAFGEQHTVFFVFLSTLRTTLLSLNGLELHGSFIAVPMLIISKHGMFKD